MSVGKYKEHVYTDIEYRNPKEIFDSLNGIELSISKGLKELQELLND